jgi:hypothetical protein
MSDPASPFRRPRAAELARRLAEPRPFIEVVTGARQVGKTTLVQQVAEKAGVPVRFASADEPTLRGPDWIAAQWEVARLAAGKGGALLVLDEVQKAVGWAESVKRLWDEDSRAGRELRVVLLAEGAADPLEREAAGDRHARRSPDGSGRPTSGDRPEARRHAGHRGDGRLPGSPRWRPGDHRDRDRTRRERSGSGVASRRTARSCARASPPPPALAPPRAPWHGIGGLHDVILMPSWCVPRCS